MSSKELNYLWIAQASGNLDKALGCAKHLANSNYVITRYLLLAGASADCVINVGNSMEEPILNFFAKTNNPRMMCLLLEYSANAKGTDIHGTTALMCAARANNVDCLCLLIDRQVSVYCHNNFGETALSIAAVKGNLESLKCLLSAIEKDANKEDILKESVLMAARHDQIDAFNLLVGESRIKLDCSSSNERENPLLTSVTHGSLLCAKEILKQDINFGYFEDCISLGNNKRTSCHSEATIGNQTSSSKARKS